MKNSNLFKSFLVISFGLILTQCEDTSLDVSQDSQITTEIEDELIQRLRSHVFTPDTIIVLENFDFSIPTPPPPDNEPIVFQWQQYPTWRERNRFGSISNNISSESKVELPATHIATSFGIGVDTDNAHSTQVGGLEIDINGNIIPASVPLTRTHTIRRSAMGTPPPSLEMSNEHHAQANQALENGNFLVAIGIGLWSQSGNIKKMWVYYAEYNNQTNRVVVFDPEDITVIQYEWVVATTNQNEQPETEFRTFDYYSTTYQFTRALITGFGAGVHRDDVTRIALKIGLVPL